MDSVSKCFDFIALVILGFLDLLTLVKFGYSEKATKFEKIFHLKFEVTQNIPTLK